MVNSSPQMEITRRRHTPTTSPLAHNPVPPPYKTIKHLIYCILFLLITLSVSVPNLAVSADSVAPRTYRVPESCTPYVSQIEKYDWDTSIVIQIMNKESRCNPLAVNTKDNHHVCMGSYNILQIACVHYKKGEDRKDPTLAIQKAYELYEKRDGSFKDWTTCSLVKSCS